MNRSRFLRRWSLLGLLSLSLLGCDPQQDQYRRALRHLAQGDAATGAVLLTALAENGHAPSQFRLGLLYRLGWGVPRQAQWAVYWFAKAA
ncbi:MAG: sel1 repeat family protein [Gammaproteobacteria bacterium]|nr:sel1 repeat family protein [Gammaproteobacteria bacterium]